MGLFWKQVFAGSNPAARTNKSEISDLKSDRAAVAQMDQSVGLLNRRFRVRVPAAAFSNTRGQIGKGTCLRNRKVKVRILPRVPLRPKSKVPVSNVLTENLDLGHWTWDAGLISRGHSQAAKAAACKAANHRFKSDCPLQQLRIADCGLSGEQIET